MRGMIAGLLAGILLYHFFAPFVFAPLVVSVFSPDGGYDIISMIDDSEKSIDIEMYVFTSRDVVDALEKAKRRGVDIRIIIERSTISGSNSELYNELAAKGFNIRYASKEYKLTHSKFMIVDRNAVLVGSHNFSNSALYKNREASVIVRSAQTVKEFASAFQQDWELAS